MKRHAHDEHDRLRATMRDWARGFRAAGLAIDRDPFAIRAHLDLPGVKELAYLNIPAPFNRQPLIVDGERRLRVSALERAVIYEELGYGDAGVTLAAPGPAMSGLVVAALGDDAQKEAFFAPFAAKPTWTFFGLSEPRFGSDPQSMTTRLDRVDGGLVLTGEKYFNGGGVLADLGVVFARSHPGPGGIDAVLFQRAGQPGFRASALPLYGVRGALSSHLVFDRCRVDEAMILGRGLSPMRRFQAAAIDVFAALRPCVAALALGVARAALDYARAERRDLTSDERSLVDALERRIMLVRGVTHAACLRVDGGVEDAAASGLAKSLATRLAEDATAAALTLLGPGALLAHPYLNKWYRDARAFEYMEGTTHIQRLNVFQSYQRGRLAAP